jgi:hypothetical protein
VALGLRWHEGWADEAQAWMLARDSGWWHMMLHGVRYEGTPGLWHSFLWVLARLHFTYHGMHYAAALVAVAGAAVFLRWAPFPRWLKLPVPFSFFLAYQDAVVARSYVLFAVLAFGAAALLRSRQSRPLLLAVVLGVMANMSAHGCIASAGLAALGFVQGRYRGLWRERRFWAGAAVLLLFWGVAVGTAWPPGDLDFAEAKNLHKLRSWVPNTQEPGGGHWLYANDQIPVDPNPRLSHIVGKREAKMSATMQPGELAPIMLVRAHLSLVDRLQRKAGRLLGTITFPLSTSRSLAIAIVVLLILSVREARGRPGAHTFGWLALLPWAFFVLVFMRLYIAPRHAGVVFTMFIVTLWLAWDELRAGWMASQRGQWLGGAFATAWFLLLVQQAGWTKDAILLDMWTPYSGDWTTAKFLKDHREDGPVVGFYYLSAGALGYLPGFHYANQPTSYWWWSKRLRTDQQAPQVLKMHPAYIVIGGFMWGPQGDVSADWADAYQGLPDMPMADSYRIANYFKHKGYIETHRLCGRLAMRDSYSEEACNIILEPYVAED